MTQVQQTHRQSSVQKYLIALVLAVLPVIIAVGQGANISGILPTLTGSAFPLAFTLMSWGIAVKLVYDNRK